MVMGSDGPGEYDLLLEKNPYVDEDLGAGEDEVDGVGCDKMEELLGIEKVG